MNKPFHFFPQTMLALKGSYLLCKVALRAATSPLAIWAFALPTCLVHLCASLSLASSRDFKGGCHSATLSVAGEKNNFGRVDVLKF